MTEKRFTLEEFGLNFIVNDNGRNLTAKKTVDLLNQLSEENEQLKDALNQRTDQCDKYYKENEQLKFQNSNLMKEVAEYSRKAKELEKRERKTEKEKDCGTCKYFQIDGMFGLWCDKGHNWENVEYCSDWKGDVE